jgi:hypothetical protein
MMHFPTRAVASSAILMSIALFSLFIVYRKIPYHQRSLRDGDVNITQLLQNFSKEFPEYINRKPDYFQITDPASSTDKQEYPLQSLPPSTRIPTTMIPAVVTTWAPTNRKVPLTSSPTTKNPISITSRPTTTAPVTLSPTTVAPVTLSPTTIAPVTLSPTTVAPVTSRPTTLNPITLMPITLDPVNSIPTTLNSSSLAPNTSSMSSPLLTSVSSSSLPVFSTQGLPTNVSVQPPPFTSTTPSNWTFPEISFGGIPNNITSFPPFIPNSTGTFGTLPSSEGSLGGMLSNVTSWYGSISSPSLPSMPPNVTVTPSNPDYQISMKPPEVNWSERHRNSPNSSAVINHSYDTASVNNSKVIKYSYLLILLAVVFISFVLFVTIVLYSRVRLCTSPHFSSIV